MCIPAIVNAAGVVSRAKAIDRLISVSKLVGVPAPLLIAICLTESNLDDSTGIVEDGSTPSYGPCQVKLATARHMDKVYKHHYTATITRLLNPYLNGFYAARVLHWNLKRYKGDWKLAADAYNRGWAASDDSRYVKKVWHRLGGLNHVNH